MTDADILRRLAETIESRKGADAAGSYVAGLFAPPVISFCNSSSV